METENTDNPGDGVGPITPGEDAHELLERLGRRRPFGVRRFRELFRRVPLFADHLNEQNVVEMAKTQFPRLEAQILIHREMQRTRRLLIVVAAVCLIAGGALVVLAPADKEKVSHIVAACLAILPLGAIGVQEFRIRTIGFRIDGGQKAVENESAD